MLKEIEVTRRQRPVYSLEEKIDAVRILHEEGYNYLRASRRLGISTTALKRWELEFGERVRTTTSSQIATESVELNLVRSRCEFVKEHYPKINALFGMTLERATQVVKEESDLDKLTRTLKTLAEILGKPDGAGSDDPTVRSITLIEQTVALLNQAEQTPIPKSLN